ncbi:mannosyltransferase [Clydaea vesicula]|uniref:Chitobiosyldiphosphodolichol beta-mannosyltransferase n=1 Tax=Clydaea vesicula TaxID=447962 RepID=A0AAD5U1Z5_9FUNG|nr:mannosyltransferase [Clydaea vesicula]
MQYHAMSLADNNFIVYLICFVENQPSLALLENKSIILVKLNKPNKLQPNFPKLFYILHALFRITTQILELIYALIFRIDIPDVLLVQNPPAIPTLFIAQIYCRLVDVKLYIDWHNFGYSIMQLSLGTSNSIVKICKFYEFTFGKIADGHFCVSNAMKTFLIHDMKVSGKIVVLYDKPPCHFKKLTVAEVHKFLEKQEFGVEHNDNINDENAKKIPETANLRKLSSTISTMKEHLYSSPRFKKSDRRLILVSSTSWTEDEDFSILFNSLRDYELNFKKNNEANLDLPKLTVVITGKGPLKEYYVNLIQKERFEYVKFFFPWLTAEAYPLLLGSADIGVCLHTSSSGLDLPMKAVDMFGCELPVLAINYATISELVKDNVNGLIFNDSLELYQQFLVRTHFTLSYIFFRTYFKVFLKNQLE